MWLETWGSMINIRQYAEVFSFPRKFSLFFGELNCPLHSFSWICVGVWIIVRGRRNLCDFFCIELAGCTTVGLITWWKFWAFLLPIPFDHMYIVAFRSTRTCMYYISRFAETLVTSSLSWSRALLTLLMQKYRWSMSTRCWRPFDVLFTKIRYGDDVTTPWQEWPSAWNFEQKLQRYLSAPIYMYTITENVIRSLYHVEFILLVLFITLWALY